MTIAVKVASFLFLLALTNVSHSQTGSRLSAVQAERKAAEARYSRTVESWVGSDINQLISNWGTPSRQYTMPNGTRIFTWQSSTTYTDPISVSPDGDGGFEIQGGDAITYRCTTEFFVNKSGVIFDWKWNGNACRKRK